MNDLRWIWGKGSTDLYAAGGDAGILHSSDGHKWTRQGSLPAGRATVAVWGAAGELILAVDWYSVQRSIDGGATWMDVFRPATNGRAIWGASADEIYLAAGVLQRDGEVYRSRDKGLTWVLIASSSTHKIQEEPWAIGGTPSGDTMYLLSYADALYRSTDRGATWSYEAVPVDGDCRSLWAEGAALHLACTRGTVASYRGQGPWTTQVASTEDLNDVWGAGDRLFAVGNRGTIWAQ